MGKGGAAAVGLHLVCCGLLPLLLIASISLAALAWAGAATAVVAIAALAVFVVRRRRARACCLPERPDAAALLRVERPIRDDVVHR